MEYGTGTAAEPMPYRCGLARLTAVRHGQSTANALFALAEERQDPRVAVPERTDAQVGLSELGLRQARALGRWLAGLDPADRPHAVVCSPYLRAVRTWQTMAAAAGGTAGTGTARAPAGEPLVEERLRDREMGVLELMTPPAIRAGAAAEAARRERAGEWWYRPPGGESLADVTVRVRDFLNELREAAAGRHVLIVAHDAVVVAVRQVLAGIGPPPPHPAPVPNASLSRWDGDGTRMRLVRYGDVGHL
jgi:broad specificity phosphatase PhoE